MLQGKKLTLSKNAPQPVRNSMHARKASVQLEVHGQPTKKQYYVPKQWAKPPPLGQSSSSQNLIKPKPSMFLHLPDTSSGTFKSLAHIDDRTPRTLRLTGVRKIAVQHLRTQNDSPRNSNSNPYVSPSGPLSARHFSTRLPTLTTHLSVHAQAARA